MFSGIVIKIVKLPYIFWGTKQATALVLISQKFDSLKYQPLGYISPTLPRVFPRNMMSKISPVCTFLILS